MTEQTTPILKLPLIGDIGPIDTLGIVDNCIELPGSLEENHGMLEDLENALGAYVHDTGEYKKILNILFPEASYFEAEHIDQIVYGGDIQDAPLFTWVFGNNQMLHAPQTTSRDDQEKLSRYNAAWSSLLLDLGEFQLDEKFNGSLQWFENKIPILACSENKKKEPFIPNASLQSNEKLFKHIWKRLDSDTVMVFIDDQPTFNDRWGLGILPTRTLTQLSEIIENNQNPMNRVWIKPSETEYNEKYTKEMIAATVETLYPKRKKADHSPVNKLVFIVDLLYKKNGINRIQGDNLIRFLREEIIEDVFIIGFTGGQSPFVIDSAVKAGADIVIMKGRANDVHIGNSHSTCNPGALFDLLWGLSKNINRMRFLEIYKKVVQANYGNPAFTYRTVLDKLFFSLDNESPFWRNYLRNWAREIEDIRIRSLLEK